MRPEFVEPILSQGEGGTLVAAMGGAILSMFFMGDKVTWKIAVTSIFSAALCSFYGANAITHLLRLGPGYDGLIGFFVGLLAMSILSGIFKLLEMWRENPTQIVESLAKLIPFLRK